MLFLAILLTKLQRKLAVTNGLEIWLDAGKEMAARQYASPTNGPQNRVSVKIINGGSMDRWHDASGNKRDVYQLVSSARPRFVQHSGGAAFRFDGADDFLAVSGLEKSLDETTIFILAAPHRSFACTFRNLTFERKVLSTASSIPKSGGRSRKTAIFCFRSIKR